MKTHTKIFLFTALDRNKEEINKSKCLMLVPTSQNKIRDLNQGFN